MTPTQEPPGNEPSLKSRVGSLIRGLYFIRFSIALWFVPLILTVIDCTRAASLTRAILTPERGRVAASAAFMIFSLGMVVMLTLRLVAINGPERFPDELGRDQWLSHYCGKKRIPLWLFTLVHLPGACLLIDVAWNIVREHVRGPLTAIGMMAAGLALAYVFWLIVAVFYWWSYDYADGGPWTPPSRLLFAKTTVPIDEGNIEAIQKSLPPPLMLWFDSAFVTGLAKLGGPGYTDVRHKGRLYEGHRLAIIGLIGLVLLYIYLFAFTAPVTLPGYNFGCNLVSLIALLVAFVGVSIGPKPKEKAPLLVKSIMSLLFLGMTALLVYAWISERHAPRGFSVLASLLILFVAIFWSLTGIAFFADGSRLPVLSTAITVLFLSNAIPWYRAEHYFTVVPHDIGATTAIELQQPSQLLAKRLENLQSFGNSQPALIIVTAEGGGIHSAAWTAAVLMELKLQFEQHNPALPFGRQLLLASGVSGGSAGLLPFLSQYKSDGSLPEGEESKNEVVTAAYCSSLQAVAWGLTYYDALNFLWPFLLPHGSPLAEPSKAPDGLDRSWALERAFARNIKDKSCYPGASKTKDDGSGYELTLAGSAKAAAEGKLPAFTFNTTAVETGDRFLLANYQLPASKSYKDVLPAESFLHVFSMQDAAHPIDAEQSRLKAFADMPLATAARLSATFPYISSAARIPTQIARLGEHYVDGGYFDNDGTSSAVEFLYYAITKGNKFPEDPRPTGKLKILLIEIRNDWDINAGSNSDAFEHQENLNYNNTTGHWGPGGAKQDEPRWGPFKQLIAPPLGFWRAGHESDTRRNRRELCMMEGALGSQLDLHHMVFDYRDNEGKYEPQPLSWELTARQQDDITCALDTAKCTARGPQGNKQRGADHAYTDPEGGPKSKTIHELAIDAAIWAANPTAEEPCKVYGRGQ